MYTVGSKTDDSLLYKGLVVSVPDDPHGFKPIKCRIGVADAKAALAKTEDLSDCYPLLPKHLNVYPKVGEYVYILTLNKNDNQQLRYFLGPVINTFENLTFNPNDNGETNADVKTNLNDKVESGIYPKRDWISIQGRENSDIVFKPQEILMRAGKYKVSQPLIFNDLDTAYIQMKYGSPETKQTSETEIVREVKMKEYDGYVTATLVNTTMGVYDHQVLIRVTDKNNTFIGTLNERFTGRDNAISYIKETFLELLRNSNSTKRNKILDINGKTIDPKYDLTNFKYLENNIPELKDWVVGINTPLEPKIIQKTNWVNKTVFNDSKGSAINVVATKINLVSYGNKLSLKLLDPNDTITADQQIKINTDGQPIPYGYLLNDFLGLIKTFVSTHVHAYPGLPPDPDTVVTQILNFDLNTILNENVRTA